MGQGMFTCTRGAYHMKAARFPVYKDLSGINFAASEINEATVRQLHRCEFLERVALNRSHLPAHSEASGQLFRQHPVSHSGVSGHLRIDAA